MPLRGCGAEQVKLDHEYQSLENIIVIQKDPLYQELWDLARLIACRNPINQTPNLMSKRIVFRPFISDNLDIISVPFSDDNVDRKVDLWMDITYGTFPHNEMIDRPLKIGANLTLSIYVKDTVNATDIRVKDCFAYDELKNAEKAKTTKTNKQPTQLQLTDANGCPIRDQLIGVWQRTRNTLDTSATMIAYTRLTTFKFPEKDSVFLACNIDLCKDKCAERCDLEAQNPDEPLPSEIANMKSSSHSSSSSSRALSSNADTSDYEEDNRYDQLTLQPDPNQFDSIEGKELPANDLPLIINPSNYESSNNNEVTISLESNQSQLKQRNNMYDLLSGKTHRFAKLSKQLNSLSSKKVPNLFVQSKKMATIRPFVQPNISLSDLQKQLSNCLQN